MSSEKNKMIHIFYRHYDVGGRVNRQDAVHHARTDGNDRPMWFDFEKCFINLLSTIKNKNVKLNVVMDGDFNNNWISKYKTNFNLYEIQAGNDTKSFFATTNIIKNDETIKNNDIIYFLEDDYVHHPDWVECIEDLFITYANLNYVSLFDHLDKYYYEMYKNLVSKIIVTNTRHWRTTPSTCGSFIIPKNIFMEDYDILSTRDGDHEKFLWLAKHRNRTVITPIPGLSSHCINGVESPTINWSSFI
jgi:hypothetical protein